MMKKKTEKGMIQLIREFIESYPDLKLFDGIFPKVDVDTLEENAHSYMIESVPAEPWVKKYLDGSGIKQVVFAVTSREFYEDCENIDTNNFYENFSCWLDSCTRNKGLPDLGPGREAMEIRATTPGYLYDAENQKAKYRIQCVLRYYQKAE